MEEILFNLVACLPALDMTPEVVLLQRGPLLDRFREAQVNVEFIDAGHLRDVRTFRAASRQIAAKMRCGRYDAVFSSMPKAHLYVWRAARSRGLPALWCQAGYPDPVYWIDRLASALPAAGVLALSRDVVAAQQRVFPSRKVHLMHPGIDVSRFALSNDLSLRTSVGVAPDAILVSLVGRLQPWKGQREFLHAAALVAQSLPNVRFAIVGGAVLGWEGDYPQELELLAARMDLQDNIIFTGHTSDVNRWMAASDIVVNASLPEPFGLVVIEAMAAGCSVIAVSKGGPRDIIEDGHSGVLCESREPAVLAQALTQLIKDSALRVRLGRAARERVQRDFSREAMAMRFDRIVRQGQQSPTGMTLSRIPRSESMP